MADLSSQSPLVRRADTLPTETRNRLCMRGREQIFIADVYKNARQSTTDSN